MDLHPFIHQLPPPLDNIVSWIFLEPVPNADFYLVIACIVLTCAIFIQLRAFARPPPVPVKRLPRRPILQVLFKPDDISSSASNTSVQAKAGSQQHNNDSTTSSHLRRRGSGMVKSVTDTLLRSTGMMPSVEPAVVVEGGPASLGTSRVETWIGGDGSFKDLVSTEDDDDASTPAESPFLHSHDLPDSFAPLLSSSQMEVLHNQVTADLIHALHMEGGVRLREGRHEIPLDKDSSRPQLVLDVPKAGCRITVVGAVGSDGFSTNEDLDVTKPTTSRSRPMVKHAGLVLDPPLPLANVAPTLIHFPTLFEDNFVPTLRRIQIVRFAVDFVVSISSFIERVLWIIESKCQIHLSKVRVTPLYKGSTENKHPEWRLSLAFSGHLLLFGWIPLPFISVVLPTFIIPQPHALLQFLLTAQPLASAKLRRENIAEQRIAMAALNMLEAWNVELKAVATPPALGVDVTLPGGITVAVEMMHGRDAGPGTRRQPDAENSSPPFPSMANDTDSLSSWTTNPESASYLRSRRSSLLTQTASGSVRQAPPFDANKLVPWLFEFSAKGAVSRDKISMHVLKLLAQHDDGGVTILQKSKFSTAGSFAVWKADPSSNEQTSSLHGVRKKHSGGLQHSAALADTTDTPSVFSLLLFPEEATSASSHRRLGVLQYDYAFDVWDDTQLDAISLSVGATHPMLKGGTMITTILESIYAFGSLTARAGARLDPSEQRRKRNILRHLPAVDFTSGIQNAFIPPESMSYSDDGQSMSYPEMEGLRMVLRIIGGISKDESRTKEGNSSLSAISEGIKFVADFAVASFAMNNESKVTEFPELDIFEGTKLLSLVSGAFNGRVSSYLRPQHLSTALSTTGPNIFNPLEAYEIDFSGSSVSLKLKEYSGTLGHRRVIIPTETTAVVKIVESIVDMSLDGNTLCELSWDFQGSSPILQVTPVGQSPASASHENKQQVPLLIPALRQGRLQFHVSSVGGIAIQKAATLREDKEGLYDWKFFNALVSPDEESAERILKVLHDKRTMDKMLQVVRLVNTDLYRILRYGLKQVWRAKEIFDAEGVSDPGKAIPGHKMARLVSLFLCGDVNEVDSILPIIRRVTNGDGLDVVTVKDLLRRYVEAYDEWAPEIDRAVRWTAVMLGPMAVRPPYVEKNVPPLSEVPYYARRFQSIPSAKQLYEHLHDKPQLPLDPYFSNLVSRIAPYMDFRQVEYLLQVRSSTDWQPSDLRRLRYVYSVKKKVLEISESYGGLTFLPQSFLVSVFLGEATRATLRAEQRDGKHKKSRFSSAWSSNRSNKRSALSTLRRKRMHAPQPSSRSILGEVSESMEDDFILTPAGRVASQGNFVDQQDGKVPKDLILELDDVNSQGKFLAKESDYQLGDSLLGPHDVAILLQAGLTSAMKSSTVVQLNQRMLLDLVASQPQGFAVAVLAEIGTPGGQGSPRNLTHALMALLDLDQSSFTQVHRLDMHALLESWLPGFKIPRREDYLAGGRWARQSYYEAIFAVATSILEDAELYMALKGHIQRVRHHKETDPIPRPKSECDEKASNVGIDIDNFTSEMDERVPSKLKKAINDARKKIDESDQKGLLVMDQLLANSDSAKESEEYKAAVSCYLEAFSACAHVLTLDKLAFQTDWFKDFYQRNYDALMVKSMYDNVIQDVDNVRHWFDALRRGSQRTKERSKQRNGETADGTTPPTTPVRDEPLLVSSPVSNDGKDLHHDDLFTNPDESREQELIDGILDAIIYEEDAREKLRKDPLVRLLIPNPPGKYNFTIVTAMGVITEGKKGTELGTAMERIEKERGVITIRADTGTARSYEFNAAKIEVAIEAAQTLNRPYGLVGYSQGCANALMAESLLLAGSPLQQRALSDPKCGLICRQLLFSAANGSCHGPAVDTKVQRLIIMCEEFFKYQQGYCSRAFASTVLDILNTILDSPPFQKFFGGAQTMLPDGARAFWREAQHLPHIPTCTLRGVLEEHTTPESLEMVANALTKQSGSALHDSQVHVFDAVGFPIYTKNRNGEVLARCSVGDGAIQRTHHWSPLSEEVEFVRTKRDIDQASFDCAKDRHIYPWVDVNVRFGIIKYASESDIEETRKYAKAHAKALSSGAAA